MTDPTTSADKPEYEKPTLRRGADLQRVAADMKTISGEIDAPECWVARAVYGAENPRWLLFRDWLAVDAPRWLQRSYLRHGPAFARVVVRSRLLKTLIRPLMDRAIGARFKGL